MDFQDILMLAATQGGEAAAAGLTYVGGFTQSIAGSTATDTTVSLTALTGGIAAAAAAGDFVLCAYSTVSTTDQALTITDGSSNYTLVGAEIWASPQTTYGVNSRIA